MAECKARNPMGVVAIMTAPDGRVIATVADCDLSGLGGFKLWEAQRYRAKNAVQWQAVQAYCSPVMFDALSAYQCHQIADALCAKGHRITYHAIGWDDEIAAELSGR